MSEKNISTFENQSIAPIMLNNNTKLVRKYKEKEKAERRKVKPGYPIKWKLSKAEADAYLNADEITCLICGKVFKSLPGHLSIHGISADEYKERYGLPYRTGLTSSSTKQKNIANSSRPKQLQHLDRIRNSIDRDAQLIATKNQRGSHYKSLISKDNIKKAPKPEKKITNKDAEQVIQYIENNKVSLSKAIKSIQVMGTTVFFKIINENNALKERYELASKSLPKGVKNPLKNNNEVIDCIKQLRAEGLTYKVIGSRIGIHEEEAIRLGKIAGLKGCVAKESKKCEECGNIFTALVRAKSLCRKCADKLRKKAKRQGPN